MCARAWLLVAVAQGRSSVARLVGEVLALFACSIQEPLSAWSVCSHNLALIQISGRAAIS